MDKFTKFVPLTKVEEQSDGSLIVSGIVTNEDVDHDGEICDFATSAPLFRAAVAKRLKLTSQIDGMTPSLMPMREMHAAKAIGAAQAMDIDETAKTIRMTFKVVDKDAIAKFKAGIYVGFSQGGSYVKKWADAVKKAVRFTADPLEVSAVDSPCLPSALVEVMKGRSFESVDVDGNSNEYRFGITDSTIAFVKMCEAMERRMEASLAKGRVDDSSAALSGEEKAPMENTTAADLAKAIELYNADREAFEKVAKKNDPVDVAALVKAAVADAIKPYTEEIADLKKKLSETPEPNPAMQGLEEEISKAQQIIDNNFGGLDTSKPYIPEELAKSQESYGSFEKADLIRL